MNRKFEKLLSQYRNKLDTAAASHTFLNSIRAGNIHVDVGSKRLTLAELAQLFQVPMDYLNGLWVDKDAQPGDVVNAALGAYLASTKLKVHLRPSQTSAVVYIYTLADFLVKIKLDSELWANVVDAVKDDVSHGMVNTHKLFNVLEVLMGRQNFEKACDREHIPRQFHRGI